MVCRKCGYQNHNDAKYCSNCRHRLSGGNSGQTVFLIAAIVLVSVALVFVLLGGRNGDNTTPTVPPAVSEAAVQTEPSPQTEPVQVRSWRDNVLMRDRVDIVIPLNGFKSAIVAEPVFGSELLRDEICRVVFEDTLRNAPEDCWDVSDARDASVLAWVIPAGNQRYELHLAAEGGINGKLACEDLFCGYANVTSIEFNNCFHTEEAEDFSRMFYGCWGLEELDLSGIRTDSAVTLSEMFANCWILKRLDVSGFRTSNVEDTSGMFKSCRELQSLDVSGFDLFQVRDISYMFNQCPAGNGIRLPWEEFAFRNVDRYEHFMDEGVLIKGKPWIESFETTPLPVKPQKPAVAVGDTVTFGTYEQDNRMSNGPESVQWLVLDVQDDHALLLSRYALDSRPYHNATATVTWETCSLREWLNGNFLITAFTEAERKAIRLTEVDNGRAQHNAIWQTKGGSNTNDYVFLLSYEETNLYFDDQRSRVCSPTDYAVNMGADTRALDSAVEDAGWWWLRSPGEKSNHASFVNFDGTRYTNMVSNGYLSVRPALWVSLEAIG